MNRTRVSTVFLLFASILLFVYFFFFHTRNTHNSFLKRKDVVEKCAENQHDTLHVLLFAKASDYFIYKGVPVGFQYDLLKEMGKSLGKTMNIVIEDDPDIAYHAALSNQYDIVAMDYAENPVIDFYLVHSCSHSSSHAVLIEKESARNEEIQYPQELHVPTQYIGYVSVGLLPDPTLWHVVSEENTTVEELFDKLEKGEIDYLVCDYTEALTLLPFYTGFKMKDVGGQYDRRWTLKSCNANLNDTINEWLLQFSETAKYTKMYKKYLSPHSQVIKQTFKESGGNKISPYDKIVKKIGKEYSIDWRLISSIMYQESKFEAGLIGQGGSFGLMQMMPETGERFGVNEESTPEEQIRAAVKYLSSLEKRYQDIADKEERLKFIAASYNSGPGHIDDARRLCEKYELDPNIWDNVAHYLALKSKPEHRNDPVVKHGAYPGKHTVKYVSQVMKRYQAYKDAIK